MRRRKCLRRRCLLRVHCQDIISSQVFSRLELTARDSVSGVVDEDVLEHSVM